MAKLKKMDRVEVLHGNQSQGRDKTLVYGVIRSVRGDKAVMVIDGGKQEISGPLTAFKLSTHPIPKDQPSVMDKWAVIGYKATPIVDEPGGFKAQITLNGVVVLDAGNTGTGGPNMYHAVRGASATVWKEFHADAKAWAIQFGDAEPMEADGLWIDWYMNDRPYGKLAKEVVGKHGQEMAKYRKQGEKARDKEQDEEQAVVKELGSKVHHSLRDEAPKLPARFKVKPVTNYAVVLDTKTGRSISVGLCDLRGATKALAFLFPDVVED